MTRRAEELVARLCGPGGHPLAGALRGLCEGSRLLCDFLEANESKVRRKLRLAGAGEELGDVAAELAVAAIFAGDRAYGVRYEPQRPAGQRSPDLEVTFRGHTPLFVEVTRPRAAAGEPLAPRLARALCEKAGQLQPGAMNLLAVVVPPGAEDPALPPAALRLVEQGAVELRPEAARELLRSRHRLSGVALLSLGEGLTPLALALWAAPGARHPLHPDIARHLGRAAGGGAGDKETRRPGDRVTG